MSQMRLIKKMSDNDKLIEFQMDIIEYNKWNTVTLENEFTFKIILKNVLNCFLFVSTNDE